MYIEPNTDIRILKNCPCDSSYINTIMFQTLAEQTSYFMSLTKYNLAHYSYQRVNTGVMRVGIKTENLYDCNYLMFRNTAFGNKWFYAFINKVNYINDSMCEINFTIDVLQSWLKDFTINTCFVEREHTLTDGIGDNLVPEGIPTGEYVHNDYAPIQDLLDLREMCVVIGIVDVDESADGQLYDGIYGGLTLWAYTMTTTGVHNINEKINEYIEKPDAIATIYLCPKLLIPLASEDGYKLRYGSTGAFTDAILQGIRSNTTLDGYKPDNNKLYTYPYNFLNIDNANGNDMTLKYEYFKDIEGNITDPIIQVSGCITQPVKVVARPCSYKGTPPYQSASGYTTNNTMSIMLSEYPMCSFAMDAWKAWVAQNGVPLVLNTIGKMAGLSALAGGGGLTTQSTIALRESPPIISYGAEGFGTPSMTTESLSPRALSTGIAGIAPMLSSIYSAQIATADISSGSSNTANVNVANGKQMFYASRMSVNHQIAETIDKYFSMYGYAVKTLKVPNRYGRPHWNYVKTVNCTITGSIPMDDEELICKIHDNGITYWHHGDEVGKYFLDNRPEQ